MADDFTPPAVPEDTLEAGGWKQTDERTETLFEMPAMRIRGATRRYEDERTRSALREATDGRLDCPLRFFAVTGLAFEPPLPPGVTPAMIAPTLRSEARRTFAKRLEARGLTDVEKGRSERMRLPDRSRARMTRFTATDPLDDAGGELPLECWVAIWTAGSAVRVVTGGYPAAAIDSVFDLDTDEERLCVSSEEYRTEFVSLLRSIAD